MPLLRRLWRRPGIGEGLWVAAAAAFMLWMRLIPYRPFTAASGIRYLDTDPYYHYREVLAAVQTFPRLPRWDPWTAYPDGTWTGQFGTPFDWVAALAILVGTGGQPTELQVANALAVYPAILGALVAIPFYFLSRRLLGTTGAVAASATLALLSGQFLRRSSAGYADHHVAEVLLLVVTLLCFLVALGHARGWTGPLLARASWKANRRAAAWSVAAGLSFAVQVLTWPAAILFGALVTLWLGLCLLAARGRGEPSRPHLAVGAVAFLSAAAALAPFVETFGFLGYLAQLNEQHTLPYDAMLPLLCLLAAAAVWLLDATAGALQDRGWSPWLAPLALAGALAVLALAASLLPGVAQGFSRAAAWVTGSDLDPFLRTIQEMRPTRFFCERSTASYTCLKAQHGLAAPAALLALIPLAAWAAWRRRPEDLLLLLWGALSFRATATQNRFSYYAALNIALMMGWIVARSPEIAAALRARRRPARKAPRQGRRAAAASIAAVALLVVPGNLVAWDGTEPAWTYAARNGVDPSRRFWVDGMEWMRHGTPDAGVDLALLARPGDGPFTYPPQSYGVLSWWPAGHFVEALGRRPPVANPFQQGVGLAAAYFTEQDPAQAEALLDEATKGRGPIRYVVVEGDDVDAVHGMTVALQEADPSRPVYPGGEWRARQAYPVRNGWVDLPVPGPAYNRSMLSRLVDGDGEGLPGYRLVWEHPESIVVASALRLDRSTACVHGTGRACGVVVERPEDHPPGSIVQVGGRWVYDVSTVSALKVYERVAGAHLVGTADPGQEVRANLTLRADGSGRVFGWSAAAVAAADGRFDLQVPYGTAAPLAPQDGGTDASVRALGPVRVVAGGREAAVDVPERAVLDGAELAAW